MASSDKGAQWPLPGCLPGRLTFYHLSLLHLHHQAISAVDLKLPASKCLCFNYHEQQVTIIQQVSRNSRILRWQWEEAPRKTVAKTLD